MVQCSNYSLRVHVIKSLSDVCFALQVFVHRIRKYIGSYLVQLKGKVDAIVMSAGVGENSPDVRSLVLQDLEVEHL